MPEGGPFRTIWIKNLPGNFLPASTGPWPVTFATPPRPGGAPNVRDCTESAAPPLDNSPVYGIPPAFPAAMMDDLERKTLEHEVQVHMRRIERLHESLRDSEENLRQVVDAPPELVREVETLRMELRGRKAALAVGLSLLGISAD
jgi:hypothetical protein